MSAQPYYRCDGILLPPPVRDGVDLGGEKLWSQNAGRSTSTGDFVGDIVALKRTVSLTYDDLTEAEAAVLWSIAFNMQAFHILEFRHLGAAQRMQCYIPSPHIRLRDWLTETTEGRYSEFTIEFIER